jgi:hypothetical protein
MTPAPPNAGHCMKSYKDSLLFTAVWVVDRSSDSPMGCRREHVPVLGGLAPRVRPLRSDLPLAPRRRGLLCCRRRRPPARPTSTNVIRSRRDSLGSRRDHYVFQRRKRHYSPEQIRAGLHQLADRLVDTVYVADVILSAVDVDLYIFQRRERHYSPQHIRAGLHQLVDRLRTATPAT